ncbi:hypothetical protein BDD12DRAFT_206753 [Trichophaea hybrida]|nr:hypothetical protein BDD12DRAFT_206753 [Trichophaea hybrida]
MHLLFTSSFILITFMLYNSGFSGIIFARCFKYHFRALQQHRFSDIISAGTTGVCGERSCYTETIHNYQRVIVVDGIVFG